MKGVVCTTGGKVEIRKFGEPLYKTVGAVVGGYIEKVSPLGLPAPYVIIVNDEGLLQDLPLNAIGSILYGTALHGNPIVGDIVVMKVGYNKNGEPDIIGLNDLESIQMLDMLSGLAALVKYGKEQNA